MGGERAGAGERAQGRMKTRSVAESRNTLVLSKDQQASRDACLRFGKRGESEAGARRWDEVSGGAAGAERVPARGHGSLFFPARLFFFFPGFAF